MRFSDGRGAKFAIEPQPEPTPEPPPPVPPEPIPKYEILEASKIFHFQGSEQNFVQEELDKNKTQLSFQVSRFDGSLVGDLNETAFIFSENKIPLVKTNFNRNSAEFAQTVDIVFTVDVTGSMAPTIEAAKLNLINFIRTSRKAGYHSRMCLVTFGDYTVRKCNRFFDNNPKDPATLVQVEELISEITKLKALRGAADPGGLDPEENPLQALIDASQAPWETGDQRFAILVTDAGFLYSPGNQGHIGASAPTWKSLKAALASSQMMVFAATPSLPGYNLKFKREAGLVELSRGEWFNYEDLVSGKTSLDSILNRILVHVNTTYVAEYVVEDQEGLDATLPLLNRSIGIELKDKTIGQVIGTQIQSNLPEGRKEYSKVFRLSDKKINRSSLKVWVNDNLVSNFELIQEGTIEFSTPPPSGAKIKITYDYQESEDALRLEPFEIETSSLDQTFELYLNSILVDTTYYKIKTDIDDNGLASKKIRRSSLTLTDRIFSVDDPFGLRAQRKLNLLVRIKRLAL